MDDSLFTLIPKRVDYSAFWVEIRKRNLWLIYLRYGAFVLLATLISGLMFVDTLNSGIYVETFPLWIIAVSIFSYNIVFQRFWKHLYKTRNWELEESAEYRRRGFRSMHFALIQICTDFIALLLFIYFTGGVETPLYFFFIFHAIIGSLLLPGSVMSAIITGTVFVTVIGAVLEANGLIPHHAIEGLLPVPLYNHNVYLIMYFSFYVITIYLSIYLTNSIARELYNKQKSLTLAYRSLEEAKVSKQRYVMSVVHDLKTPIAAVITYISMLLEGTYGNLAEELKRPLVRSKKRLDSAINTINNILYISQLKLQSKIDELTDIDLGQLLEEIYSEMAILIKSKQIEYSFECPENHTVVMKAERKLMKLALSNMVSNAYKYTEAGGRIKVAIYDDENSIQLLFADSGIGIPENEKNKIFQDFYRSSISKSKGIEGTGLGISIVVEVIERYRGKIEIKSPSGLSMGENKPGTEFLIKFPKAKKLNKKA